MTLKGLHITLCILDYVFIIFVTNLINLKIKQLNFNNIAKPFLRWEGGKSWLLKHLTEFKKQDFSNYHEPFLGGAAVFLNLHPPNKSYLSDLNGELIETYCALRDDATKVIL